MVNYKFEHKTYGVFGVEDQRIEICPMFKRDGDYAGISVTIYSTNVQEYEHHRIIPGRGAIIFDRYIEINGTNGYTKNIVFETNIETCRLSIHFGYVIDIEYACKKK